MLGTFHFHSKYSHDGKHTLAEVATCLREQGFRFCVMTEHFEDFDSAKFSCYIDEIGEVSRRSGFILIPGMEANVDGLDIISFPVAEYAEIARLVSGKADGSHSAFRVLAHPSKYPFDKVLAHLDRFQINGIELWNQQADGGHIPPLGFLRQLKTGLRSDGYRYFFGCDLHSITLTVMNVIEADAPANAGAETIIAALVNGEFTCRNLPTGIEYSNRNPGAGLQTWIGRILNRGYVRGRVLRSARTCMRWMYKALPRDAQHSLNDFKNFVRNKV